MSRRAIAAGCVAFFLFLGFMAFLAYRDHVALDRCHSLNGRSDDQGEHCYLPDGQTVDTHNSAWPW